MYFGGFFFPCVDYSIVFNYSNTGIEIILYIYRNISTTANILQPCNQEDFTLEVICCCTYEYNVVTFVCTTSYLFPSSLVSYVNLNLSSHLTV